MRELTSQELHLLRMIARDYTNQEIANVLDTTEDIVRKSILPALKQKLGIESRVKLALYALQRGIVTTDGETPMTLPEYQQEVKRTTGTSKYLDSLVMTSMGLAGEAGEVIDILKKHVFHAHELDRDKIVKELGDVTWYLSALCNALDISLDEVLMKNVEKLRKRYPDGFDIERSKNREEVQDAR